MDLLKVLLNTDKQYLSISNNGREISVVVDAKIGADAFDVEHLAHHKEWEAIEICSGADELDRMVIYFIDTSNNSKSYIRFIGS